MIGCVFMKAIIFEGAGWDILCVPTLQIFATVNDEHSFNAGPHGNKKRVAMPLFLMMGTQSMKRSVSHHLNCFTPK